MKYLFLHYPKCGTCIKAAKWLRANGIDVEARDITLQNPTAQELLRMDSRQRTPIRKFLQHQRAEIQGTEPERKRKQQPAKSCCPYSPPTASWSNARCWSPQTSCWSASTKPHGGNGWRYAKNLQAD